MSEEQKVSQEDPLCPICNIWRKEAGETLRKGLTVWFCSRCDWGKPIEDNHERT